jgi:hypothetical protein
VDDDCHLVRHDLEGLREALTRALEKLQDADDVICVVSVMAS